MISSFLCHTLLQTSNSSRQALEILREDTQCAKVDLKDGQKNISAISMLYQYTNPPPLAYGSPAPKVAESILRSREYNSLPNGGRNARKHLDTQKWTRKDGRFPFSIKTPTSNINLASMRKFSLEFCAQYHVQIDQCARALIETIRVTNADVLTRGRQTWDPFMQRSVPSPNAFKEMLDFFTKNLGESNFTMLGWIKAWSSLFEKTSIQVKQITIVKEKKRSFCKIKRMTFIAAKTNKKIEWKTMEGNEKDEFLLTIATEFCSYLKSKERSKLKRRAIASANMILRMYFDIIERFHLDLGKVIPGSTISKGGVEKRTKIIEGLSAVELREFSMLATEDATKWNECLAPSGFWVMHHCFFDYETRRNAGIPCGLNETDYELLSELFSTGIYLLSRKRIFLGQGHVLTTESFFTRHKWHGVNPNVFNENTRRWYDRIKEDLDDRDCVYSPYGMLMGMLNAASTTYGLVPITAYRQNVAAIRSSDDSITLFTASNQDEAWELTRTIYARYKLIGINISPKKTRFFRWPYGEYTSWYIDGKFSSQYGVELSTIRPKGDTPHTDFHGSAVETNVSLREFRVNNFGAEMMLALKIANTRRLWRIKEGNSREGVSDNVILLADGGRSPWHSTNSHLSEISIKKMHCVTKEDTDYLWRIININNPFSAKEKEIMTFSKEMGRIINDTLDIPRNAFSYIKRPNKTLKENFKTKMRSEMDAASFIVEMCEKIEPSFAIAIPKNGTRCGEYMLNCLNGFRLFAQGIEDDEIRNLASVAYNEVIELLKEPPKKEDE